MKKFDKSGKILLILLLVFVIPLVITVFIVGENMDKSLKKGSISSVTLIMGEEEKEVKDEEDLNFFISVAQSGDVIESTADPLNSYRKCEAVFHKLTRDVTYTFYLSDSVYNCVYVDEEGTIFLIPETEATQLLAHPLVGGFAVSYATYPTLTLEQGGKTFRPALAKGEWKYDKTNETESAKKVKEETDDTVILPQGEELNFNFSIDPDFISVMLTTEKGEVIYSGSPEEMPLIERERDENLVLTLQCEWYEENHEEYHGSITYTFPVFYDIPTLVTMEQTSAAPGEVVIVKVQHSSSEDIAVSATFATTRVSPLKSSGVWSFEVYISPDAQPGEYNLMIMGSDVETTLPFTIVG